VEVKTGSSTRPAEVEFAWYERDTGPVAGFSVSHSGARAWRDDLIAPAGTSYFPSSFPSPVLAPRFGKAEVSRGASLVLSSGGYGLFLAAKNADEARIFQPDPDTLRVEVKGSRLRYLILPGAPKQVLRARALMTNFRHGGHSAFFDVPVPRAVNNWKDLRKATHSMLSGALTGRSLPTLVLGSDLTDSEFALRALQVAALQPASLGDLTPERFGDREESARRFFRVHSALGTLLERYEGSSKDEGVEALRPIVVEYPDDQGAWKINDQWLLGSHLLVAPILKPGATNRKVYIPRGNWLDLRSRNTLRGPKLVTVNVPVDSVALFVKQSSAEQFEELAEILRTRE